MRQEKWEKRDRKQNKRKNGMRISGKSVFTLVRVQVKKSEELKNEK